MELVLFGFGRFYRTRQSSELDEQFLERQHALAE